MSLTCTCNEELELNTMMVKLLASEPLLDGMSNDVVIRFAAIVMLRDPLRHSIDPNKLREVVAKRLVLP